MSKVLFVSPNCSEQKNTQSLNLDCKKLSSADVSSGRAKNVLSISYIEAKYFISFFE